MLCTALQLRGLCVSVVYDVSVELSACRCSVLSVSVECSMCQWSVQCVSGVFSVSVECSVCQRSAQCVSGVFSVAGECAAELRSDVAGFGACRRCVKRTACGAWLRTSQFAPLVWQLLMSQLHLLLYYRSFAVSVVAVTY